ncbi:hypothetical protein MCOO_00050 [Mycobacterium cookii]|uniref:Ribonuclease 3 n=1 Tax=Mycobacterium cookii TaxID=1775 RepID=A0A7I7KP57_9MYCO|nr:hypothetical protein MCOO_00050 [Mycobacterium cookii]
MSDLFAALGVELDDELLTLALTHRSYAYEHGGLKTNERLEFLGDAVLGLTVTQHLYHRHPERPESDLAKMRAGVVNTQALARVARGLTDKGLGAHLLLGRGELKSGGADKSSILADSLEALLGAIYLQHGMDVVQDVILRLFTELLDEGGLLDWKTSLQELAAARGLGVVRGQLHWARSPAGIHRRRPRDGHPLWIRHRPDQERSRTKGGREGRRGFGATRQRPTRRIVRVDARAA